MLCLFVDSHNEAESELCLRAAVPNLVNRTPSNGDS